MFELKKKNQVGKSIFFALTPYFKTMIDSQDVAKTIAERSLFVPYPVSPNGTICVTTVYQIHRLHSDFTIFLLGGVF